VIHGATIGKNCLIGMNAVIMDNVLLEDECIVGALSFIKADEKFERRSLIVGNPAKKIKEVSDEMIAWKTQGTQLYQALPKEMYESWQACEPLREMPTDRTQQETLYQTWNAINKSDL
jgi:carbonic anhydrase/acetyltransferase-like protein (isoleucine patch superfamily)